MDIPFQLHDPIQWCPCWIDTLHPCLVSTLNARLLAHADTLSINHMGCNPQMEHPPHPGTDIVLVTLELWHLLRSQHPLPRHLLPPTPWGHPYNSAVLHTRLPPAGISLQIPPLPGRHPPRMSSSPSLGSKFHSRSLWLPWLRSRHLLALSHLMALGLYSSAKEGRGIFPKKRKKRKNIPKCLTYVFSKLQS